MSERQEILDAPKDVFARLAAVGGLQIVTRHGGIVHEQFGAFSGLRQTADGKARLEGEGHYTLLSPEAVAMIELNREGGTLTNRQPRVDFLDAGGQILVSVLGPHDDAPWQALLDGFDRRPLPEAAPAATIEALPVDETDPTAAALQAAANSGRSITVEFHRPGVHSSWSGRVEGFRLGPKNINVMQDDFHLHLKGGAIASWSEIPIADGKVERRARDAEGRDLGLVMRGEAEAFA